MGCCAQKANLDQIAGVDSEFFMLTSLPTFENIHWAYNQLNLPDFPEDS